MLVPGCVDRLNQHPDTVTLELPSVIGTPRQSEVPLDKMSSTQCTQDLDIHRQPDPPVSVETPLESFTTSPER